MAVLDAANRGRVFAHVLRTMAWPGLLKADVDAAVAATDQWIDDNATSYNQALPLPFRSVTSLTQKTLLFCYVAMRRAGILRTEGE
jgi:hypothetical protein